MCVCVCDQENKFNSRNLSNKRVILDSVCIGQNVAKISECTGGRSSFYMFAGTFSHITNCARIKNFASTWITILILWNIFNSIFLNKCELYSVFNMTPDTNLIDFVHKYLLFQLNIYSKPSDFNENMSTVMVSNTALVTIHKV